MKKTLLLLSALLMTSMQMFADFNPQIIGNAPFMSISPNGKYGIFTIDGIMLGIVDLDNPENASIYMDERGSDYYQNEYLPGYGTCVANDGTAVGNTVLYEQTSETTYASTDNAVVYANGELKILPSPRPDLFNMAHAITPDGSVICGNVGNDNFGIDSRKIMMVPAVWYRNADGEYDAPVLLPHPDTDFLGGTPQYVTANAISADGNTVAGTITATSGFWCYPIVYKRDVTTGEWSYTLPSLNLFYTHPEVIVPADPGDYPEMKSFMTDEEKTAYTDALAAWQAAGGNDWDNYPRLDNFMSDEEKTAYQDACTKYENDKAAYDLAVDQATAGSITMTFNNVVLSPDGKFFASTYTPDTGFGPMAPAKISPKYSRFTDKGARKAGKIAREGEEGGTEYTTSTTFVFNLEDGSYKAYTCEDGANVTCAGDNGIFLGYGSDAYTPVALVMDPKKGVSKMQDYYQETCPEMTAWINENMAHEVKGYDYETGEMTVENRIISGIPFCTPDMTTLVSYAYNSFDNSSDFYYFGYVFKGMPDAATLGVKNVVDKNSQLSVQRGGIINVDGQAYVEVFAADGSKVFAGNVSGAASTGLRSGVYVVRAKFADGKLGICKALF